MHHLSYHVITTGSCFEQTYLIENTILSMVQTKQSSIVTTRRAEKSEHFSYMDAQVGCLLFVVL